jgi:hypothetical protein
MCLVGTSLDKGEELDALAKLPSQARDELVERAASGEKVSAKSEIKKNARSEKETTLATAQRALPDKKYGVIYADPEWRFEVFSRDPGMDRAADNHYPTSATDAITGIRLWISAIAAFGAPVSTVQLWISSPLAGLRQVDHRPAMTISPPPAGATA